MVEAFNKIQLFEDGSLLYRFHIFCSFCLEMTLDGKECVMEENRVFKNSSITNVIFSILQ